MEVTKKLEKFMRRGYIAPGNVISLISYFAVPKGDSDICLVFDGTNLGLNSKLWAPPFCLPSIESLLPMLEPGTWQSDIDVGEQFYNYLLHPTIRPFCGIDVDPYLQTSPEEPHLSWLQWQQCVMGLASSPHGCVKMQMLAEKLVRGDHLSPSNPFFYDQVRLIHPYLEFQRSILALVALLPKCPPTSMMFETQVRLLCTAGRHPTGLALTCVIWGYKML
jgi:hypothetical protein